MSHVLLFSHEGVACAVPAGQVLSAGAGPEPQVRLWRPGAAGAGSHDAPRSLLVATASGPRRIACADARFTTLDESTLMPLPDLLRAQMGLAHVVGVAQSGDTLVWLVDLLSWEDG